MKIYEFIQENETGKLSLQRLATLIIVVTVMADYAVRGTTDPWMLGLVAASLGFKSVQRFGEKGKKNA